MNQRLKILIAELKKCKKVYSQAEFAEIVGISRTQFSEIVTGKRKLSDKAIHKIIAALPEINEKWLRSGEGEMLKNSVVAESQSISIAGEEIKENEINVNTDATIAALIAEVSAQRRLTESALAEIAAQRKLTETALKQSAELIAKIG